MIAERKVFVLSKNIDLIKSVPLGFRQKQLSLVNSSTAKKFFRTNPNKASQYFLQAWKVRLLQLKYLVAFLVAKVVSLLQRTLAMCRS